MKTTFLVALSSAALLLTSCNPEAKPIPISAVYQGAALVVITNSQTDNGTYPYTLILDLVDESGSLRGTLTVLASAFAPHSSKLTGSGLSDSSFTLKVSGVRKANRYQLAVAMPAECQPATISTIGVTGPELQIDFAGLPPIAVRCKGGFDGVISAPPFTLGR